MFVAVALPVITQHWCCKTALHRYVQIRPDIHVPTHTLSAIRIPGKPKTYQQSIRITVQYLINPALALPSKPLSTRAAIISADLALGFSFILKSHLGVQRVSVTLV